MNYKELAPIDKPPFPFPKDANGAYPFETPPAGVLNCDPAFQGYFILMLAAAQKVDADATISIDSGIAAITVSGKTIDLTSGMQHEVAAGAQTVEQQVNRALGIVAPVAPLPPDEVFPPVGTRKIKDGKIVELQEWPFGLLWVAAKDAPPPVVPPATIPKADIVTYLKSRLAVTSAPDAQDELVSMSKWVAAR